MSYTKQNFVDGNVLTAEELNNIENGVVQLETDLRATNKTVEELKAGSSNLIVNITTNDDGTISADKTVTEIITSHNSGQEVVAASNDYYNFYMPLVAVNEDTDFSYVVFQYQVVTSLFYVMGYIYEGTELWTTETIELADTDVVDQKITTAIGDIETLLQSI